jgi:hypothetical protein
LKITNAVSDSKPDPQQGPPYPAGDKRTSADGSGTRDTSPANDDVQIDSSTADALRFWLRLVALS